MEILKKKISKTEKLGESESDKFLGLAAAVNCYIFVRTVHRHFHYKLDEFFSHYNKPLTT